MSAETSGDRVHRRLVAGGTAAARSRRSCGIADAAPPATRVLHGARSAWSFAEQALCGFPQSIYICALVYGAFVAVPRHRPIVTRSVRCHDGACCSGASAVATALGAAAGAIVLLPLSELGSDLGSSGGARVGVVHSPRVLAAEHPHLLRALHPRRHRATIRTRDRRSSGRTTATSASRRSSLRFYGAFASWRRRIAAFIAGMTVVAYLLVLGSATPVFHVAYLVIPGMKLFRFPTRFLIVVELGLALLAALGLTRLRGDLARRLNRTSGADAAASTRIPASLSLRSARSRSSTCAIHQPRQNPMVPAREWLAPPASVAIVNADGTEPRTFTPWRRDRSIDGRSRTLHGWANLQAVLRPSRRVAAEHRRRFLGSAVGRLLRRHLGPLVCRRLG